MISLKDRRSHTSVGACKSVGERLVAVVAGARPLLAERRVNLRIVSRSGLSRDA